MTGIAMPTFLIAILLLLVLVHLGRVGPPELLPPVG